MKKISIITPCFNEAENVELCARKVREVMCSNLPNYDYEHIFADNASTDKTVAKLKEIAECDSKVKVIVNSRNVGPFGNMWNAMKSAEGDAIIPLVPADLQDPPEVIPSFVDFWEKGNLIVYGIRKKREESLFMRFLRGAYYRIVKRFSFSEIPLNAGEFLLADRKVVTSVLATNDYYPYIRGLIAQTQAPCAYVQYTWTRRRNGKSKNNFVSLIDQAINGFVSTSRMPARVALLSGIILAIIGIALALYTAVAVLIFGVETTRGIPTLVVLVSVASGVQLMFLGLIGEYVISIHGQVRRVPQMFEVERINFD